MIWYLIRTIGGKVLDIVYDVVGVGGYVMGRSAETVVNKCNKCKQVGKSRV